MHKDLLQLVLKFQHSAYNNSKKKEKQANKQTTILHVFSVMATSKCNWAGDKEKEQRKCMEELRKQSVGSRFNENLFMNSFFFFSQCQMYYYIYM